MKFNLIISLSLAFFVTIPSPVVAYRSSIGHQSMLRLAVVGLSHDHVNGILRRAQKGTVQLVAIVEKDRILVDRMQQRYGFSSDIVYSELDDMLASAQPEAVAAFNMICQHIDVVEHCAPLGIHVMVEKPLAANLQQAERMMFLAEKHRIHLLTNYETTWYPSNALAQQIIRSGQLGTLRKIIFKTGHKGPREIGCSADFLTWLTDPVLNGGGALTDFGCYGANLATWLMRGQSPDKVFCITQQMKPDIYPKVEDEATIILTYTGTQVIIQASWNWTYNRKDMEVYGDQGYLICKNASDMLIKQVDAKEAVWTKAPPLSASTNDPFRYLQHVVLGKKGMGNFSPSSLENNMVVMQILEAAKISADSGEAVDFKRFNKGK